MCDNMKMKNIFIVVTVIVAGILMGTSCSSSKDSLTYFENIDNLSSNVGLGVNDFSIKIVPDDELKVVVTSQVPEATAPYNVPIANYATKSALAATGTPALQTYKVDKSGNIVLPVIGTIHVAGKTTDEVADYIRNEVAKDVNDPYVTVSLYNFRINVLGEVNKPGCVVVSRERYSILDALADANDMTEYGKRENVLLIREVDGKKQYVRLNLQDAKLLESPYFYLQQNDVVYVEPNTIKKDNSKYNQNNSYKLSVISTIVSACSIVASLIIALAVK